MALQTLPATAATEAIQAAMERDGAAILSDVIGADLIAQMTSEVTPYIERMPWVTTLTRNRPSQTGIYCRLKWRLVGGPNRQMPLTQQTSWIRLFLGQRPGHPLHLSPHAAVDGAERSQCGNSVS